MENKYCPVCNKIMVFISGRKERERAEESLQLWKKKVGRICKNKHAMEMVETYTKRLEKGKFVDVWLCDECNYCFPPVDSEERLRDNLAYLEHDIQLEKERMERTVKDFERQMEAIKKMLEYYKENPSRRG